MNDALCQTYYAKGAAGRFAYKVLTHFINKSIEKGQPDLNIIFIYNMPFRGIAKIAGGMCTMEMAEGILTSCNGHFFKGLGGLGIQEIATRQSCGETLKKLRELHNNVMVLDADLANAIKTDIFKKAFPDRRFDCGITESDMMCVAAGLAIPPITFPITSLLIFRTVLVVAK